MKSVVKGIEVISNRDEKGYERLCKMLKRNLDNIFKGIPQSEVLNYITKVDFTKEELDNKSYGGQYSYGEKKISIVDDIGKDIEVTIFHEIVHARIRCENVDLFNDIGEDYIYLSQIDEYKTVILTYSYFMDLNIRIYKACKDRYFLIGNVGEIYMKILSAMCNFCNWDGVTKAYGKLSKKCDDFLKSDEEKIKFKKILDEIGAYDVNYTYAMLSACLYLIDKYKECDGVKNIKGFDDVLILCEKISSLKGVFNLKENNGYKITNEEIKFLKHRDCQ